MTAGAGAFVAAVRQPGAGQAVRCLRAALLAI